MALIISIRTWIQLRCHRNRSNFGVDNYQMVRVSAHIFTKSARAHEFASTLITPKPNFKMFLLRGRFHSKKQQILSFLFVRTLHVHLGNTCLVIGFILIGEDAKLGNGCLFLVRFSFQIKWPQKLFNLSISNVTRQPNSCATALLKTCLTVEIEKRNTLNRGAT